MKLNHVIKRYVNETRKQNADSTYTLRISLTVADSATVQYNYTHVLLFVCGFHKLFWIPQNSCGSRKFVCFWSDFERCNVFSICLWTPKQQRRSWKSSNVADFATNLILACCGIHIQCTECTVWPRNDKTNCCNKM